MKKRIKPAATREELIHELLSYLPSGDLCNVTKSNLAGEGPGDYFRDIKCEWDHKAIAEASDEEIKEEIELIKLSTELQKRYANYSMTEFLEMIDNKAK